MFLPQLACYGLLRKLQRDYISHLVGITIGQSLVKQTVVHPLKNKQYDMICCEMEREIQMSTLNDVAYLYIRAWPNST